MATTVSEDYGYTAYLLSRKWWNVYTNSPHHGTKNSNRLKTPDLTLHPAEGQDGFPLQWDVEIDPESNPEPPDYIILDPLQWDNFCKWYNGGSSLTPKHARGFDFHYSPNPRPKLRFTGREVVNPLDFPATVRLAHGDGIDRTVAEALNQVGSSGAPVLVHAAGVWPDDIENALPFHSAIRGGRQGWKRPLTEAQKDADLACHVPAGMANLGATCYMNAALQLLLRPLGRELYGDVTEAAAAGGDAIIGEFHRLWTLLLAADGGAVRLTDDLIPTIRQTWARFRHGTDSFDDRRWENAAEEFLRFVLAVVLQPSVPRIRTLYGIRYVVTLTCARCGASRQLAAPPGGGDLDGDFVLRLHLPAPLPTRVRFWELVSQRFGDESQGDDAVCEVCGEGGQVTGCTRLLTAAEFLIVSFPWSLVGVEEIGRFLDLRSLFHPDSVPERTKYELRGVIDRFGAGEAGHFTATVLHGEDRVERWTEFDDAMVQYVENFEVNPETVTVLLYKLC